MLARAAVLFVLADNTVIVEHQGGTVGLPGTSCEDGRGRPAHILAHHVEAMFPVGAVGVLASTLRDTRRTWVMHSTNGGTSYVVAVVAAPVDVVTGPLASGAWLRAVGFDSVLPSRLAVEDDMLFVGDLLARVFGVKRPQWMFRLRRGHEVVAEL